MIIHRLMLAEAKKKKKKARQQQHSNTELILWGLNDCCILCLRCGAVMVGSKDSTGVPVCPQYCQSFRGAIRKTLAWYMCICCCYTFSVLHIAWQTILKELHVKRHEIPLGWNKTKKKTKRFAGQFSRDFQIIKVMSVLPCTQERFKIYISRKGAISFLLLPTGSTQY